MSDLKAQCSIDLSYPYHGDASPLDRLAALSAYVEAEGCLAEGYLVGDVIETLEQDIARLLGKEAAMWCPTGTMAQGIAIRLYAEDAEQKRFQAHPTSHLLLHEQEGYSELHGLEAITIGPWNDYYRSEDLRGDACCALLELPQRHNGGQLPDWETLCAIKERAGSLNLPLHMDGARLWSCRLHYDNRSYAEIVEGFSSVYVSFYKDIGALGGAMLAANADFIQRARRCRDQMGGLLANHWPLVADTARLLPDRLGRMDDYVRAAQTLASALRDNGVEGFDPSIPHTNLFHLKISVPEETALLCRDKIARDQGVWLANRFWEVLDEDGCRLEIVVGDTLLKAPQDQIVNALCAFALCAKAGT
ncbi:MAG: beta-eliminating lyase-related protein [Pseudomonadota bacterium]